MERTYWVLLVTVVFDHVHAIDRLTLLHSYDNYDNYDQYDHYDRYGNFDHYEILNVRCKMLNICTWTWKWHPALHSTVAANANVMIWH